MEVGALRHRSCPVGFKVLYTELQPCVLIACECNAGEPNLLLIRSLNQFVECGFCHATYSIEVVTYATPSGERAEERPNGDFRIRRRPPRSAAPSRVDKLN